MTQPPPPARLFILLARQASVGVILRRGPSDWVQMIKWHTDTDKFEEGQWFHGRVYEQLSDLSPNGKFFTYHAFKPGNAVQNPSYGNRWTALSNPPKFTAVTLWPFHGDDPKGGAYFVNNKTLILNHDQQDNQHYHFKHTPPKQLKILLPDDWDPIGRGPENTVGLYSLVGNQLFEHRLDRDGWKSEYQDGNRRYNRTYWRFSLFHESGLIWFKNHKSSPITISVMRTRHPPKLLRNYPVRLPPYLRHLLPIKLHYEYILMNHDRTDLYPIDNITWADFDQQGRLVLAKEGKLFSGTLENDELQLTELADFNANQPDRQPASDWAQKW